MILRAFMKKISIFVYLLALSAPPAHAANWGPFVEGVLDHLVAHMSKEAADLIVERVTRGQKIPTLQLTSEQIKKLEAQDIQDYVAKCLWRAKWLDDNDPRPYLVGPIFERELASYRVECGQGPKVN
jgi:hypothetical protein